MLTESKKIEIGQVLENGRPRIDTCTLIDREKMRVMQVVGNAWPIRVEVTPLAEEGQPYTHISQRLNPELKQKVTGVVPVGKVYIRINSEAGDLTDFFVKVSEILTENSRG